MSQAYKLMKVFDSQYSMPRDVKDAFFRVMRLYNPIGNDVYVNWHIASTIWEEGEGLDNQLVDKWLIENGADGPKDEDSEGETVLIAHWW